jgi:iron(III) transport system permease protein
MTLTRRLCSIALVTLAVAVVFSPLVAALFESAQGVTARGPRVAAPLARSLTVSLVAASVALALGVPFALLVDRARPRVRRVCWGMALLSLIVPPYLVAESLIVLLGPAGKISRGVALLAGAGPNASDAVARARFTVPPLVYSMPAAGIVMGGCLFAVVALAVAGVNRRADRRMFESARLMAGNRGVIEVAARLFAPPAIGAALLVFAITLTESVVPQLLRLQTLGEAIYEWIQEGALPAAAAMSLCVLPLILLSGVAGVFMLTRVRTASTAGIEGDVPRYESSSVRGMSDAAALGMTAIAIALALLVPAAGLGWLLATANAPAVTEASQGVLGSSGFFGSFGSAWAIARDDAVRTIWLATLTATLGIAFAVVLIRTLPRGRVGSILGVLSAGLAVPAPIVGLGLITLWNREASDAVYGSEAIVLLAWLSRFLPAGVLLTQVALSRVPMELEEAAALSGCGSMRRFFGVILPTAAPGLLAAWIAVYVLSATEFAATLLVAPPGAGLLAPSVVNLIRRGQDSEIAACQVLLLAVVVAPLIVFGAAALVFRTRNERR